MHMLACTALLVLMSLIFIYAGVAWLDVWPCCGSVERRRGPVHPAWGLPAILRRERARPISTDQEGPVLFR